MEDEVVKDSFVKSFIEWFEVVLTAVIAVIIIFSFIFRIATVVGESMQDTFYENERVVITKLFYTPKQGDVVVISRDVTNDSDKNDIDQKPIIKRIIATEGQTVDIDFDLGVVYVDGKKLEEDYTKTPTNVKSDVEFPLTVPEDCVFVLGDNRNSSMDSRYSSIGNDGMIDTRYIIGRVVFRIFPFDRFGGVS